MQSVFEQSLPDLIPDWMPVRVAIGSTRMAQAHPRRQTRQTKRGRFGSDAIRTERALDAGANGPQQECREMRMIGRL
jgi:hypothetical protein